MKAIHSPVLLEEAVQYLAPRRAGELMVDATLGEGGHSFAFLSRFPELKIIGIDADKAIQAVARERLNVFGNRVCFYTGWSHDFFVDYPGSLFPGGFKRPDTILIDLGVSLYHYEKGGRGFSFKRDEPLDMRIDQNNGPSAAEFIAKLPEKDLADLLYRNAEERYSRRIAHSIAETRSRSTISSSAALAELIERAVPASYRYGKTHPATKTFQALRIEVNGELTKLPELLNSALRVLEPGGRLGVISFHSLEDRIVKNFFKVKNRACTCPPEAPVCTCKGRRIITILTPKGLAPGIDEMRLNPPSRSARLRVVEKLADEDVELVHA